MHHCGFRSDTDQFLHPGAADGLMTEQVLELDNERDKQSVGR